MTAFSFQPLAVAAQHVQYSKRRNLISVQELPFAYFIIFFLDNFGLGRPRPFVQARLPGVCSRTCTSTRRHADAQAFSEFFFFSIFTFSTGPCDTIGQRNHLWVSRGTNKQTKKRAPHNILSGRKSFYLDFVAWSQGLMWRTTVGMIQKYKNTMKQSIFGRARRAAQLQKPSWHFSLLKKTLFVLPVGFRNPRYQCFVNYI